MQEKGVSVLICTYNGAGRITTTLQHLARQKVNVNLRWEILLLDNCSTDNTQEVAMSAWKAEENAAPFCIINVPVPGKHNAVDLGFAQSRYGYVLICDDDNWLDPKYVQTAWEIMEGNPEIAILGGQSEAIFEAAPPSWFKDFEKYYAVGTQGTQSGEIPPNAFLWGAGSIINKKAYQLLQEAGYQRVITFQKYPRIARGEDVELCYALKLTGYKAWYDSRLQLQHYMTRDRLQWKYFLELSKGGALSSPLVDLYKPLVGPQRLGLMSSQLWLRAILKRVTSSSTMQAIYQAWVLGVPEGDKERHKKLFGLYKLLAYFWFRSEYDRHFDRVQALKQNLQTQARVENTYSSAQ